MQTLLPVNMLKTANFFPMKINIITVSYGQFKDLRTNSVDPDEAAHNELPHLGLRCLQF